MIPVVHSTPDSIRFANFHACQARRLPDVEVLFKPRRNAALAIVAAGQSVAGSIDKIRAFRGDVMVCSTVHDFIARQGIVPDYVINLDAVQPVGDLTVCLPPKTRYLLASTSPPALFDHLAGRKIYVFHASTDIPSGTGLNTIPGGSFVPLRAWPLGLYMGHRSFHFFGLDSCLIDGAEYVHGGGVLGSVYTDAFDVRIMGQKRLFKTRFAYAAQAEQFFQLLKIYHARFKCTVTVHGDGLISAMHRAHVSGRPIALIAA